MSPPFRLSRRSLFGLAAGGALSSRVPLTFDPALATGHPGRRGRPERPALDVAAPRDSALGAWARDLPYPLGRTLAAGQPLDLRYGGGVDGVTEANQFDARAAPDGATALVFGGCVALAWLASDDVRLDWSNLLPIMAAFGPGALMVQGNLPSPGASALRTDRMPGLRVAIEPHRGAGLTALLGLDLLGIPAVAVQGDPIQLGTSSSANAVFLHGPDFHTQAAVLSEAGFRPAFSLTGRGGDGAPSFLSAMPTWRLDRDPLVSAWRAMAASCALCAAVAVPVLTPAGTIERWRLGAQDCLRDSRVAARAGRQSLRLVAGTGANNALSALQAKLPVQAALRNWIAARPDVRQG